MGLWDGLEKGEIFEQGQYFPPGEWTIEISRCLTKRARKTGQDLFIVECDVITSSLPGVARGARYTWCQSMKNRNVALNSIYAFVLSAFDLPRDDKAWRAEHFDRYIVGTMDRITGAENGLGGRMMALSTWNKKTEKNEDFTVHDWDLLDYASMGLPAPISWEQFRVAPKSYGGNYTSAPPIFSPDGRQQFLNGQWVPVSASPPPQSAIPMNAPRSPDGRYYWSGSAWLPI